LDYPVKRSKQFKLGFSGQFAQPRIAASEGFVIFTDIRPKDPRDGYHLIIHDPYEIPSDRSANFYTLPNRTTEYFIVPKISSIDDSLEGYDPEL
jgi:hypothetical protein